MKISALSFPFLALMLIGSTRAQTSAPAPVTNDLWKLDVGLNYVTGSYGFSQDTTVWVQTTSISYEQAPWKIEAVIPLVSLSGPASVIGNVGRSNSTTQRGLGDVTVAGTYKILQPGTTVSDFDLTGRVKLPTADETKGLGTGQADFSAEVNYHHNLGTVTPFATLGYTFYGHSVAFPLKNGLYFTLGLAAPLEGTDTTTGLAFTWHEPIVANAKDAMQAMAFINHRVDDHWNVLGFVLAGFTIASPDFGLGGSVGYKF